ncbi:MAG: hypothetical protein JO029_09070 [Candidatus Eremiobacteraeota bacterium]|nr:hypothetical protein [Candidatus Eremiobacteraeota bacterium]
MYLAAIYQSEAAHDDARQSRTARFLADDLVVKDVTRLSADECGSKIDTKGDGDWAIEAAASQRSKAPWPLASLSVSTLAATAERRILVPEEMAHFPQTERSSKTLVTSKAQLKASSPSSSYSKIPFPT